MRFCLLSILVATGCYAQVNTSCQFSDTFTGSGVGQTYSNTVNQCNMGYTYYSVTGFTSVWVQTEISQDGSTWTVAPASTGSQNPSFVVGQGIVTYFTAIAAPFIRFHVVSTTGTGSIKENIQWYGTNAGCTLCGPTIPVTAFGVLCNGSNDDAPGTQLAVNYAGLWGGIVSFVNVNSQTNRYCVYHSSVTIPRGVRVKGFDMVGTYLLAQSPFTASTITSNQCGGTTCSYFFSLGGNNGGISLDYSSLEDATLDAQGNTQTVISLAQVQEGSYLKDLSLFNSTTNGLLLEGTGVQNSFFDDLYINGHSATTPTYHCIDLDNVISRVHLQHFTCFDNGSETFTGAAVQINNAQGFSLDHFHIENWPIGAAGFGVGAINDMEGNTTVTNEMVSITQDSAILLTAINPNGTPLSVCDHTAGRTSNGTCDGGANVMSTQTLEYYFDQGLGGNFISSDQSIMQYMGTAKISDTVMATAPDASNIPVWQTTNLNTVGWCWQSNPSNSDGNLNTGGLCFGSLTGPNPSSTGWMTAGMSGDGATWTRRGLTGSSGIEFSAGGLYFLVAPAGTPTATVINPQIPFKITSAGAVQLPLQPALTGTRYLCVNTSGTIVSQTTACSGT